MRPLLLAVALAAAPARAAVVAADPPAAADWRKSDLPDAMKDALRGEGLRLEDDGRVLDGRTRAALTPDQLAAALARIGLTTQRLALERLSLLLAKDPLSPEDRAAAEALKGDLPPDVAAALDARAGLADLRRATGEGLARVAAYFDGARTLDERRANALPVRAGPPGARAPLPYFDESERRLGDALRAAAARTLDADPFGRRIVARLNGRDGRPDLPPIVVEDLSGEAAAYDYRRRALVVDRASLIASVAGRVPAMDRTAVVKSLGARGALIGYLNAHPDAVAAFAAENDALLAHELTHAWQDRREPVMQEMARGNLPEALLVEYEREAWTTKNLYISSRLARDPAAKLDGEELRDFEAMADDYGAWAAALRARYQDAAVNAMDVPTAAALQRARLAAARDRKSTRLNSSHSSVSRMPSSA